MFKSSRVIYFQFCHFTSDKNAYEMKAEEGLA